MTQSVERPTSAQITISRSVGSSPASGSVPTARSLGPASDSVSPSRSAPPLLAFYLSLSLSKINIKKKNLKEKPNVISWLLSLSRRKSSCHLGRGETGEGSK